MSESADKPKVIDRFRFDHFYLSNFYPAKVRYNQEEYASSEHAYQAAKFLNSSIRKQFQLPGTLLSEAEAKKLAYRSDLVTKWRPDWEEVKVEIMAEILRAKFSPGSKLAEKLIETGDAILVEGNFHGDDFWGLCMKSHKGLNILGMLLMEVRENLLKSRGVDAKEGS